MDNVTTREAVKWDIPVMARLLDQLYAIEPEFTPNYARQKQGLEQCLERPDLCRLLVAEFKGEVVGLVNLQYSVSSAYAGLSIHIDDFIVADGLRGRGIGSALMQAAINFADEENAIRVTLNVDIRNDLGMRFYKKWGFETVNLMRYQRPIRS